jgi:hypothetical protein
LACMRKSWVKIKWLNHETAQQVKQKSFGQCVCSNYLTVL